MLLDNTKDDGVHYYCNNDVGVVRFVLSNPINKNRFEKFLEAAV